MERNIFQTFICAHSSGEKDNSYSFFGAQYSAYKNVKDYSQIKHKLKLNKKKITKVFKVVHIVTALLMNTQKLLQK